MQAALPMMVIGSLVQGVGGIAQGVAANKAGKYNSQVAEANAVNAENDGVAEAARIRDAARVAMGEQLGSLAGNGFEAGTGSALTRLSESAIEAELEIADARRTARSKAMAYRAGGALARAEGRSRLIGSLFGAAAAVANGVRDYASAQSEFGYGSRAGGGGSTRPPVWGEPGHEDARPRRGY